LSIPTKAERNTRGDEWYAAVSALEALRSARQTIYSYLKEHPFLDPIYLKAQASYVEMATAMGVEPQPVFDLDQHVAKRLAEGNPDYVAVYWVGPGKTVTIPPDSALSGES